MAADQDRFSRVLMAVSRGLNRIGRERARAGDVTPQQAETLQLISERGAVSTSTLATLLGIDPSTASRNLSGLEREGFITRKKGSDDGRQTDVRLSPRGKRTAESVTGDAQSAYSSIMEKVSRADRAKVVEGLEILSKALDKSI